MCLLFSVEIIGTLGKGAERWIKIFGFSIQPSEIIKVSIVLALAKFYHSIKFDNIGRISYLIIPVTIIIIPFIIVVAFATKGLSLYLAKSTMIGVAEEVKKLIQCDMVKSFIKSDTHFIEGKHSGKYISNLNFDVELIKNVLSVALLNLFKDTLTLIGLLTVMFYQNWKLSIIALIMIPLASIAA